MRLNDAIVAPPRKQARRQVLAGRLGIPKVRPPTRASNVVPLRPRRERARGDGPSGSGGAVGTVSPPIGGEEIRWRRTADELGDRVGATPSSPIGPASDFWAEDGAYLQDVGDAQAPDRAPASAPVAPRVSVPAPRLEKPATLVRERLLALPRRSVVLPIVATLAVLIAYSGGIALGGIWTDQPVHALRPVARVRSMRLADPGPQVAYVIKLLAPAHLPPLAGRRVSATRSTKPNAATTQARGAAAPTPPSGSAAPPTYAGSASTTSADPGPSPSAPTGSDSAGPAGPVGLVGAGTSPSG
jgi:hypothetical protein